MKNLNTIFIVILLSTVQIFGQNLVLEKSKIPATVVPSSKINLTSTYKKFLNNSKWLSTLPGIEGQTSSIYQIVGETQMNNHIYKVIEETNVHLPNIYNDPNIGNGYINSNLIFSREDSITRKVFVPSLIGETILYDFSLNLGDPNPIDTNYTLSVIDSILTPDGYHKRFIFSQGVINIIWIEGIGNLTHPFESGVPFGSGMLAQLICAYQNGNLIYDDGNAIPLNCSTFTAIDEMLHSNSELKIFPNPSSGKYLIGFSKNDVQIQVVQIYDYTGKLILEESLKNAQNSYSLDLSNFQKGIFTIKVRTNKSQFQNKIVLVK